MNQRHIIQPSKPEGTFDKAMEAAPEFVTDTARACVLELWAHGAKIGYMGEDSGQWCLVTDVASAVQVIPYVWKETLYYQNARDTSRYLSVSDGAHYVGFYNWSGATGWKVQDGHLVSEHTNAALSYWSSENGWLYANDGAGYTRLDVKFVS